MIISNVKLVVQYSKDRPLQNFINKMVECRKEADRKGHDDLVQLYKLVVNS